MSELVDVIEVQIKAPHEIRVMKTGSTKEGAEAFIKLAIMRRGVENQFYKTRPTSQDGSKG